MMTIEKGYQQRYKAGNTPWDTGKPDFNLVDIVTATPISGCKAIDIGCGTGDNSIWLAGQGFDVTGTDVSEVALEKAHEKAAQAKAGCNFMLIDFMRNEIEGRPFGFAFDRGCLHSFTTDEDRKQFAGNAANHLEEGGLWLTIAGNADEKREIPGPPQRTAAEIVTAVEPFFEILLLETTQFGSNAPKPPRAWKCLMRKRPRLTQNS